MRRLNPFYWLWLAQDALRRLINRLWYCSTGEHRPDDRGRCKDCGG